MHSVISDRSVVYLNWTAASGFQGSVCKNEKEEEEKNIYIKINQKNKKATVTAKQMSRKQKSSEKKCFTVIATEHVRVVQWFGTGLSCCCRHLCFFLLVFTTMTCNRFFFYRSKIQTTENFFSHHGHSRSRFCGFCGSDKVPPAKDIRGCR